MNKQATNLIKLSKKIKKELDDDRYRHTLGVMYTAASLAMRYDVDIDQAQLAGLLHDCAKCIPNDRKLKLCERYGLTISEVEHRNPSLLHARLGAELARDKYEVEDEDILDAIRWHTTGRPAMTMLEKIIFLSDYIEPGRWKAENLSQVRSAAFSDIDLAVYMTLRDTLAYLEKGKTDIDQMTNEACTYYTVLQKQKAVTASATDHNS